ncbi:MAG: 3-phosphoshikimate 1-carboxyvinyltransferase [Bacteroidales bacterium]
MKKVIEQFYPAGKIHIPGSKSFTQRALAAALLADGVSVIRNPSRSDDALHAMKVIERLGAAIADREAELEVKGGFAPLGNEVHCGESGLAFRLFSAIVALHDAEMVVKAGGTLRYRPMDMIENSLQELGVRCKTHRGHAPVKVQGPLRGGKSRVDGSKSSQFLSGLLMALPLAENDSELEVDSLKSKPYVDMTLEVLESFGIRIDHTGYRYFHIPGRQRYRSCRYTVEGDWSGAAFFLVAGALGGPVEVTGLDPQSGQADRAVLDVLEKAGAKLEISEEKIRVSKGELRPFDFDATDCPDLFPPLVPLAAHAHGKSTIRGITRLFAKESNRARVLEEEFAGLGVKVETEGDVMQITPAPLKEGEINPHGDHRIAMAAAVMAAGDVPWVSVSDPGCTAKSYPAFFDDIQKIGGNIL